MFFLVALYYEVAKSLPDRIRRKMLSVGAVVFIIGSVFATISAQKSACPEGGLNGVAEDEIAELLIPSRMEDSALSRNVYGAEDDYEDRAVWSLTNGISFDSFALTATSRVFGIGWTQGLSSYFPLLDLAYKPDLTNDEWSVFKTEDVGGSMTNEIVLEIMTAQMPTNSAADKGFYQASMRKDPNPRRNTDGDYFTDREELGDAEVCPAEEYLWFDISSSGTDLLFPYYQRADLEADVDFPSPHVFNGIAYSGARVGLDGCVYFKDAALTRINTDACPCVHLFGVEPMADAWNWGSGVYFWTVVSNGQTYDVIEYLNIGMYEYNDEPASPLISCEVIIPRSEPDTIYVSYANVDDEIRNEASWLGYVDTSLESVIVPNGYYQLEYPAGSSRPVPYTTTRYFIGTGTDPRVFDDYTPPVCGQTAAERALVETSVGHNLNNGLYELTASVTNNPVVPVRITVGDRSVTMTNCGECVFLCEKGVEYPLAVTPSYFSAVEFSARDDIAPPMMMVAGIGGDAGATWTVDNRLTLVPPVGSASGRCLWLPTFTAGPHMVGHWYPDDGGMRFTAYLTDYPGSNEVSYAWSCSDENVHIASPSAMSTMVSLRNSPNWGTADLSVSATVDGYQLSSTLVGVTYGAHSSPQVSLELDAPEAVLLNSNEVSSAKLRKFEVRFHSDVPTNGIIRLQLQGNTDAVKLWTTTNRTSRIPNMKTWDVSEFTEFAGYIEGVNTSSTLGDVTINAQYHSSSAGDDIVQQQQITVVRVGDVEIIDEPEDGLVVALGAPVALDLDVQPDGAASFLSVIYNVRRLRHDGSYTDWMYATDRYMGSRFAYNSSSGGIYQVQALVGIGTGAIDERYHVWKGDENRKYGFNKRGAVKSFGVVSDVWQELLRGTALTYLGSEDYLATASLPQKNGFPSYGTGVFKCNIFVAHCIVESGLIVPRTRGFMRRYPPLANDWASASVLIDHWEVVDDDAYPEPGYVVADPSSVGSGHMGILDFDGQAISAGANCVNRIMDGCGSDLILRKYRR